LMRQPHQWLARINEACLLRKKTIHPVLQTVSRPYRADGTRSI
jgi:hypothetical protein